MTFVIVLVGWIFSLCLHEFSHALVAYYGGDYTVREKGYLTFNPFKYTHPLYSIALPLVFLALGGIGLPGGAVYIETWRLRSKKWMSAVSLAGPLSNLVLAIVIAGVFWIAKPAAATGIWPGLAFLGLVQVSAVILNLIPAPPFDGYGALAPHLPYELREKITRYGSMIMLLVFVILWYVPFVNSLFWTAVGWVTLRLGIPLDMAMLGLGQFQFWRK